MCFMSWYMSIHILCMVHICRIFYVLHVIVTADLKCLALRGVKIVSNVVINFSCEHPCVGVAYILKL